MRTLLLVLSPFLLVGFLLAWERFFIRILGWRANRSWRNELQRLVRVPTTLLVARARESIKFEHWEHFGPASQLLQDTQWTDEKLRVLLDELYAALVEDDRAHGRSGRESNRFEFHDCGLAGLCEALQARAAQESRSQERLLHH